LIHIVEGLKHHNQKVGNILYENEFDVVTSDLGIGKTSIDNDDEDIYDIISYMTPEILQGKRYTIVSDIYSFGMIMWELITERKLFWDQNNDIELIIKICKNFHPPIIEKQECWLKRFSWRKNQYIDSI